MFEKHSCSEKKYRNNFTVWMAPANQNTSLHVRIDKVGNAAAIF